jgi:hypothetical protein
LIVNAISAVAELFYDDKNTAHVENTYLMKWGKYDFSGEELFPVVSNRLKSRNKSLGEYFTFIKKIPLISSFIKVQNVYKKEIFLVTLFMTLDCFRKYTAENFSATLDVTGNVDSDKQEVRPNTPKKGLMFLKKQKET